MCDPVTTTNKAIEESAKTFGKALELASRFVGEPFAAAGDIVSDQLRYWQWSNRLKLLDKAAEKLKERGVKVRKLTPEFFLPLLVESGNIHEETAQETWARLLAEAVQDPTAEHIGFVKILSGLNSSDIKVIQAMVEVGWIERGKRVESIAKHMNVDPEMVKLSINALEYHGFFTPTQKRLKGFAVRLIRLCMVDSESLDKYIDIEKKVSRNLVMD